MSMVSISELEDFKNALKKHGYAASDFEVTEHEEPPASAEVTPVKGTVEVTHIPTSVERIYAAGFGTHWVADFEDDLAKHVFRATI